MTVRRIHHTQIAQALRLSITLKAEDQGVMATDAKGNSEFGKDAKEAIAKVLAHTSTADVMKALRPAKKGSKKIKRAKKAKFTCTNCGEHKYESDGEEDGGFVCSSCGETADVEVEEDNGRSVVKKKYKRAYRPFKGKCGDTLADKITAHVMVKHEGDKKFHVDPDRLKAFAKANGVWDPAYVGRNNGLVRMSMRNRLQGKLNRKELAEADIKWPK